MAFTDFIACFFTDLSHASTWAPTDSCILAQLSLAQCDWKGWCAIESAFCGIGFMKTARIQTPATSQRKKDSKIRNCILPWFWEINYQPVAEGDELHFLELVEPDQAVAKFALFLERWAVKTVKRSTKTQFQLSHPALPGEQSTPLLGVKVVFTIQRLTPSSTSTHRTRVHQRAEWFCQLWKHRFVISSWFCIWRYRFELNC